MTTENWFSRGTEAAKKAREAAASRYKPTVWVKPGESAKLLFLDGVGVNLSQHRVQVRDKWKTYTCLGAGCPMCIHRDPQFVVVYRVLDLRSWTDKQGKTHKNVERYYEAGSFAQEDLEILQSKNRLKGNVVELRRKGEGTKTRYTITHEGRPKAPPPDPKLDTIKDYRPRTKAELLTVSEAIWGVAGNFDPAGDSAEEDPADKTVYYEDEVEEESAPAEKPMSKTVGAPPKGKARFGKAKPPAPPVEEEANEYDTDGSAAEGLVDETPEGASEIYDEADDAAADENDDQDVAEVPY